jgi:hypothetical protein
MMRIHYAHMTLGTGHLGGTWEGKEEGREGKKDTKGERRVVSIRSSSSSLRPHPPYSVHGEEPHYLF